ncbi:MAG TPA: hypothetical protein VJV78_48975, partial [Polyangiales bacterium]|nr:hypothetical protein [Polyangiales bacterium]
YLDLSGSGWPLPPADGERGGSASFDLYLVPGAAAASDAGVDALLALSDLDAAQTHALVRADLSGADLEVCVHSAYAQAALRAADPAEAASWSRASAEWSAFVHTGRPGCEDSLVQGQQAPEHSLLGSDAAAAGSGALFLAMLSERHDGGDGQFVRALWELTRQHSKGLVPDDQLRGSPDLWEALARALESGGERWSDAVEEFSASRYFAGDAAHRGAAASYRAFAALPSDAGVPLLSDLQARELPRRIRTAAEGGIEALGSSYVRLQLTDAPACAAGSCELRVWLRGELGPNWSLCALRLDARGRELGRTRAPAREVPEAYLPLVLGPDTAQVVLVVTHLTRTLPDADRPILQPHGVELAIELVGG